MPGHVPPVRRAKTSTLELRRPYSYSTEHAALGSSAHPTTTCRIFRGNIGECLASHDPSFQVGGTASAFAELKCIALTLSISILWVALRRLDTDVSTRTVFCLAYPGGHLLGQISTCPRNLGSVPKFRTPSSDRGGEKAEERPDQTPPYMYARNYAPVRREANRQERGM